MIAGTPLPSSVLHELRARYAEPQRHYHTLSHIEHLLALLDEYRAMPRDRRLVALAIWFHDAIYEPKRTDNEARSAELARGVLSSLCEPAATIEAVERMVLATAGHRWTDGQADTAFFLDLDLSILGAEPPAYDRYVEQVRAEYCFVPGWLFRFKRGHLLRQWLARPALYFTEALRARFEAAARANIARELQAL